MKSIFAIWKKLQKALLEEVDLCAKDSWNEHKGYL
jgi:hypothetical protein